MKRFIPAVMLLAAIIGPAWAADPTKMPSAVDNKAREAGHDLPMQIALGQNGIITAYAAAAGIDGMLREPKSDLGNSQYAILLSMASREAEVNLGPLQRALSGYDADERAIAAVRKGIGKSHWFHPARIDVDRLPNYANRTSYVLAGPNGKSVLVDICYYIAPEGARLEAIANIATARRQGSGIAVTTYFRVTAATALPHASLDPRENIRSWSANKGALAKAGLNVVFEQLGNLAGRAIDMTPAEVQRLNAKDAAKTFVAGRYGPKVELESSLAGASTIWAKGLFSSVPLSVAN